MRSSCQRYAVDEISHPHLLYKTKNYNFIINLISLLFKILVMRPLFICLCLIISLASISTAQKQKPSSEPVIGIEPTLATEKQFSLEDINRKQQRLGLSKWVLRKMKKTVRGLEASIARRKTQLFEKILPPAIKVISQARLSATLFNAEEAEESEGLSAGAWALITFLASLLFLPLSPGLGLLTLLVSFILSMIGTVRDKNGLAILILVLSSITFLLLLVLALFEAFLFAFFFWV